jgi:hypothetical protein
MILSALLALVLIPQAKAASTQVEPKARTLVTCHQDDGDFRIEAGIVSRIGVPGFRLVVVKENLHDASSAVIYDEVGFEVESQGTSTSYSDEIGTGRLSVLHLGSRTVASLDYRVDGKVQTKNDLLCTVNSEIQIK